MKDEKKTRLKKQLITGGIYIALAATVVGVTTNTVVSMLSGGTKLPDAEQTKTKYESGNLILPELPEIPDEPVSGTQGGVDAKITVPERTKSTIPDTKNASVETKANSEDVAATLPEDADTGYAGYLKPCDGYISREYSDDVLVYSPTMYDYRTHIGLDIAADVGTPVKAISGGVVTEIADDDMYGKTLSIESREGLVIRYCNLSPELPQEIVKGKIVQTGDVIAGIGETALCESAEAPHIHIEATRAGEAFDPSELFADAQAAEASSAAVSEEID